jgi:putrescine aminotransferase
MTLHPSHNQEKNTEYLQKINGEHHMQPFSANGELAEAGARIIDKADGCYIWDTDGNKILDAMSGLWCTSIGYGRDEIADAVAEQMKKLPYYNTFFKTSHSPAALLAERLATLAPEHINKVFFSSGGSDANDTNIRLVRHYWATKGKKSKKTIIARHNAYHGSTVGAASLGGMKFMHEQGDLPIPGIVHINQPYWYAEGGDKDPETFGLERARELEEKILELGEDNVAAFIGEPIQGAGGVIIPPDSYWPEIQRICDKYEILLIADEVICGFGRTGNWFASTTFNIKPDLITIAKGLSSGYLPIGGVLISDRVADVIYSEEGGEFNHGYTYSGHPATCIAALKNLDIMERENLIDRIKNELGPYLKERWLTLSDHPLVGEARLMGTVGAIELTPDKASRAPFKAKEGTVGTICRDYCFANNLIMRAVGDTMIISPQFTMSFEEVDELVAKARLCLDKTLEQITAENID